MKLISINNNRNINITLKEVEIDMHVPDDFYSTTNRKTRIYHKDQWLQVKNQRMDALIVVDEEGARCVKLREIKKGNRVVCGDDGVETFTDELESGDSFGFMNNTISSERRNDMVVQDLAYDLVHNHKRLTIVGGPVIVHTGGDQYLAELIKKRYIASVLGGNAIAVHDIEKSLFGTSLGVSAKTGRPVEKGYRNHMRAINQVMKYGSIKAAVKNKVIKSGIMYECVMNDVPFVLAGSLRDDGPLPDTINNMVDAQSQYNEYLQQADIVIVLGSMLHGIASGNMLPADKVMICVDINSAVVAKLSDRGSSQAQGIVTDVGLFLNLLVNEVTNLEREIAYKSHETNTLI